MSVRPAGVRKIFDLANKIKDPINLGIGEPDFDIPDSIKEEGLHVRISFASSEENLIRGIEILRDMV
jgi:aspartate/methionine/tyrosine aminotransferase